ncbi:hypothetical protein F0L68_26875 [Solihabitans fulvus]|uniref:Uncharacterized protein n=1 Tax=Solihabitans fulvus TaxID=1892852 RepID=A0A5B2WVT1_9PSEU|nr:hypothetical protein [Solihabitans fulvus]KAA2256073.1 hypothetical protein F0L68_26875 [Solihabitans fulvus]
MTVPQLHQQRDPRRWRRLVRRGALMALFTSVQVWATVVVLARVHADGLPRVALALALAGGLLAVLDGWQQVRILDRQHDRGAD